MQNTESLKTTTKTQVRLLFYLYFFYSSFLFICLVIIYNWCSCVQGPGPHQKPPGSISTVWMVDICWMPKDDSTLDSSMGSVLNTIRKSPAGGRGRHIIFNTPILIYRRDFCTLLYSYKPLYQIKGYLQIFYICI